MRALPLPEPQQWVLEQGKERHGLEPTECHFRRQPREQTGAGVGQRVTT